VKLINNAILLQPRPALAQEILECLPKAKRGIVDGKDTVAVRHEIRETHALREIGFDVPSPIKYGWDFPGMYPPRDNQVHTAAFATLYKRGFILNEMRTGKSFAALWAAEYLLQEGLIRRVLVVCPKTCIHDVWEPALFQCLPHRSVATLYGSREKRLKALSLGTDFCIINHDGIPALSEQVKIRTSAHWFCKELFGLFDLIIYDEANVLCNHRTRLYQSLESLVKLTPAAVAVKANTENYEEPWLWLMTGTPTPTNYVDAWGLLKLVCKSIPVRSWTQFRELMMVRISQWKWVNKQGAKELLFKFMQPSIRFTQAQCFDLPPVQEIWRSVELSKEQKLLYKKMQRDGKIEREAGAIQAANAAVKVAKLLQISSGAVRDEFENEVVVDASPRLEALRLVLEELGVVSEGKKSVIFMPYTYVMHRVLEDLENHKFRACLINGSTPTWKRKELLSGFRGNVYDVLVAHPETMAHGVDLTCAESVIWYAPCYGAQYYQQGNQRIQGQLQTGNPVIVHMAATQLERERYKALQDATKGQADLMALYEIALEEVVDSE